VTKKVYFGRGREGTGVRVSVSGMATRVAVASDEVSSVGSIKDVGVYVGGCVDGEQEENRRQKVESKRRTRMGMGLFYPYLSTFQPPFLAAIISSTLPASD
jgi:hypothetical protein